MYFLRKKAQEIQIVKIGQLQVVHLSLWTFSLNTIDFCFSFQIEEISSIDKIEENPSAKHLKFRDVVASKRK